VAVNQIEAMKASFTFLIILCSYIAEAQLTITPGGSLHLTGNAQLTLQNMSFVNNGSFFPDSSTVLFTGNKDQSIGGTQTISFFDLIIDMQHPKMVSLLSPISVGKRIYFENGYLFAGNYDVNLGRTARLQNEFENQRLWTDGTGRVIATSNIDNLNNALPGNMGLSITTDENLGDVVVRRGYLSPVGGLPSSAMRYYEIVPEFKPANPSMKLSLKYWDNELNGVDENNLQVFHSPDGVIWNNLGFSARSTTNDWVERDDVQLFGRYALAFSTGALPVIFASIQGRCEGGKTIINWQTAQEQNSLHFDIQRQEMGVWKTIGTVFSAGNSNALRSYNFADPDPQTEAMYRIVEKGMDGRLQYSSVLRMTCQQDSEMKLWPNPAGRQLSLQISIAKTQLVRLQIWDAKGAKVKEQTSTMQKGVNVLQLQLGDIIPGTYFLSIIDAKGKKLFSNTFLKQ
jgi:hypothetical protein